MILNGDILQVNKQFTQRPFKFCNLSSLLIRLLLFLPILLSANEEDAIQTNDTLKELQFPSVYVETIWESHYVSEGRDYLEGDGIFATFASIGHEDFALDASFREGLDLKYSELNIGPSYEHEFDDFTLSAYYYNLQFIREDLQDHEIGVGMHYHGLPLNFSISANTYYSFKWYGNYSLVSLIWDYEIIDGLFIQPRAVLGMNSGYVPEAHDGPDHFALRLDAEYVVTDHVSLTGYIRYNWEIEKESFDQSPGDYDLGNYLWTGLGVAFYF